MALRLKTFISLVTFFHGNGKTKSWDYIKSQYNLASKLKPRWIQLTGDAVLILWKDRILNCRENSIDLCIFDHLQIKKQLILLEQVEQSYKNQLLNCIMRYISTVWISTASQYIYNCVCNCRYKIKSFSA